MCVRLIGWASLKPPWAFDFRAMRPWTAKRMRGRRYELRPGSPKVLYCQSYGPELRIWNARKLELRIDGQEQANPVAV